MEEKKGAKLQFGIDIALTVGFLVMIFFFLIATIVGTSGLFGHAFYIRYLSQYLDDVNNYTPLDLVEASIHSLGDFIGGNLYGSEDLGKVNSAFQYALGKKLVSTGGTQMIRLNTGHLYDLQTEKSMEDGVNDILAMRDIVPEDVPFVFVYEHSTLYDEEAQMPAGYGFFDYGTEEADEVVNSLRGAGVDVIDSREVLPATGLKLEDYLLYTDQHWSTRAAIVMARTIAAHAEELTGAELPVERLDIDQFDTTVYPKLFLGRYGQRVGTLMIDPDDITVYTPKYDTDIQLTMSSRGVVVEREGAFEKVLVRSDALEPQAGKSWNTRAYVYYGQTEDYDFMTNKDGGDCTILLLKDSFSAPIGRFLSLVADHVYSVDMRSYYSGTLQELIEKYDPDVVVAAYSLQMLRNENYKFE